MSPIVTSSTRRPQRGRPPFLLFLVALAILALAAALVLRFSGGKPEAVGGTTSNSSLDSATPSTDPSLVTRHSSFVTPSPPTNSSLVTRHSSLDPRQPAPPLTNSTTPKLSWEEAESNRLAKSEAIMLAMAPKKHFDNEVENTLDAVFRPGAQFLQMPFIDMSQEEVVAYLKRPVEIYDDDDEAAVAAKERTAEAKAAALKFIEQGGTINQFIRDQVNAEKERQATTAEIRAEMRRILLSEGAEAAQAYLDNVNPLLEEQGCQTVKIGRGEMNLLNRQNREKEKK